jgi:hypothetical protein
MQLTKTIKRAGLGLAAVSLVAAGTVFLARPEQVGASIVKAECTNAATDAALINAAITGSSAGDEIVISGPCSLTSPVILLGERAYRGDSRNTLLKQADNANLAGLLIAESYDSNSATTGTPITLRDLKLDGNKVNNTTAATDGIILRSWQTTVSDLQVKQFAGNGIRLTNQTANGTALTNTQVNGRISNVFVEHSGKHGIFVEDTGNSVTDWNLIDNWVSNSGQSAIHLDNGAGWVVERNHVYGVGKHGIYVNRTFGTSIADNYVEDFGQMATAGTYYGIVATVQGSAGTTIHGNRVFNFKGEKAGSTYRYLGISQVNYGTGLASVTGNTIRGTGSAGSTGLHYSKGNGTALDVASTGNNVINVGTERYVGSAVTVDAGQ